MKHFYDLQGEWGFCEDNARAGIKEKYYKMQFDDTIMLPNTISSARKVAPNRKLAHTGYLTDPYVTSGYMWFSKNVTLSKPLGRDEEAFLILERTRVSTVWVDGVRCGEVMNSLCASHRHNITRQLRGKTTATITVMTDNSSYPVPGGHMTSPDTQTNWNGITGRLGIEICSKTRLEKLRIIPEVNSNSFCLKGILLVPESVWKKKCQGLPKLSVSVSQKGKKTVQEQVYDVSECLIFDEKVAENTENGNGSAEISLTYTFHKPAKLWDEFEPNIYTASIRFGEELYRIDFGMRQIGIGCEDGRGYFVINGDRIHLRGKHDGLIFPKTGYAPTDLKEWLRVMGIAKEYGINHYRFHTSCPPQAAFEAADKLGIYMEPELPFWGTVGDEEDDSQRYLITEGYRILDEFGNHPSFVMMSMGNELWGSKERLNKILGDYKTYDNTKLYTQGSNNYQFIPCVLENDDFFVGVRFSRDRLFRGSYAQCDAPLGHIQTDKPNSVHHYDDMIHPKVLTSGASEGGLIEIQYGTGVKTVSADSAEEFETTLPVVSHEVGQYETYPDFNEIKKYKGVLKAKNLSVFRERLKKSGMISQADDFFRASGALAADCWREEIEAALRSADSLAGFQLLDLQDFTGQGTALVGVLNSMMQSKGIISREKWAEFCSQKVLLLLLEDYVCEAGQVLSVGVQLYDYTKDGLQTAPLTLYAEHDGECVMKQTVNVTEQGIADSEGMRGVFDVSRLEIALPACDDMYHITLHAQYGEIHTERELAVIPKRADPVSEGEARNGSDILITENLDDMLEALKEGKRVLFLPGNDILNDSNSVEGAYCTDFWCYPMFRSISESMNRKIPVGTHGYLINKEHGALTEFPSKHYSTPQWFEIAQNSRTVILDGTDIMPIVQTIDNFERNHKLGTIFELVCEEGRGKLLVCTSALCSDAMRKSKEARQLLYSLEKYMGSDSFAPKTIMKTEEIERLFR